MTPKQERRYGKLLVSERVIDTNYYDLQEVLGAMVVTHVDRNLLTNIIGYFGYCKEFDVAEEYCCAPVYIADIIIGDEGEKSISFRKLETPKIEPGTWIIKEHAKQKKDVE